MSKSIDLVFCELPATPYKFDVSKFKAGDPAQITLYKNSKKPNQKSFLPYDKIAKDDGPNYARFVPEDCCFIDFDSPTEAEEMRRVIIHSKLKCLILKTVHGYHFLFRRPDFYKSEITGATNWFGYKFDCKAQRR